MSKVESKDDARPLEMGIDDLSKEKDLTQRNIKLNSAHNECADGALHKGGNMGKDGNLGKNDKKRERDSTEDDHLSMNAQREGNAQGTVTETNCVPELRKKKKKKHEIHKQEHGNVNVPTSVEVIKDKNVVSDEIVGSKSSSHKDESILKSTVKERVGEDSEGSNLKKRKNTKDLGKNPEKPKAKDKSKRVSFAGKLEIFPSSNADKEKPKTQEDNLLRGKRFTPEEDDIVKEAVMNYIKSNDLGEEGLKMVLHPRSYPGMENCWKTIGACIPYRPYTSIYYRAHILFERGEKHKWTKEETDFLKKSYERHGNDWKKVAEELGKHRIHVKDKWRLIKPANLKGGKWSQEEYQNLYDLVNLDLQMKVVSEEKKSKHGMLRDNIHWGAVSDKLSTRSDVTCCKKWYRQLTSSLVAEDKWSNSDDYKLISVLYERDAACVEDVDWDSLLEHRSGDVCRKRWDQMVLHIGHHGSKPFSEQVEILSKRYCPDLAETREAWDNLPSVQ